MTSGDSNNSYTSSASDAYELGFEGRISIADAMRQPSHVASTCGRSLTAMKPGDTVDDFELPDQTGTPRKLSALLSDGPVVLFFYPAAMTPGCTKEACHFRNLAAEFAAIGASRVGISTDPVQKQAKFVDMHKFDYPLLSDADGSVAAQFGVKRGLLGKVMPVKRTTFVIDTDRKVLDVISSEFSMDTHADKALETLRARSSA